MAPVGRALVVGVVLVEQYWKTTSTGSCQARGFIHHHHAGSIPKHRILWIRYLRRGVLGVGVIDV